MPFDGLKRPMINKQSYVTTPGAARMMHILGGITRDGLAVTRDEMRAIQKMYGFKKVKPFKKPKPPLPPDRKDFEEGYKGDPKYSEAVRLHEAAKKSHANWQDPSPLFQAGADRNAIRHAELDGLRIVAWLARFIEPGEDPLKTLVSMAIDAGWDVDVDDVSWVEETDDDSV